jgi:hypothetical protein
MPQSLRAWQAVGDLAADAAELVFRLFRRQQLEKFLPGLEKLGLRGLPDAVACAQYHYLSNDVGGVRVEYMAESDRKAWVRYVPPRRLYEGATICAVPSEVTRAILRGWHANNGVLLGNDRLGFVCTKMTTDGQPGLEGYYFEADHPQLCDDVRLRCGRSATTADLLGVKDTSPEAFADFLTQLGLAQGDDTTWAREGDELVVRQTSWRLMGDARDVPPAVFDAWNELWVGALSIHDRRGCLRVDARPGVAGSAIVWRIAR